MPLKSLFKGDGGDGRRESGGGGNGSRSDAKLLSKAKALLQNATAPLSARRERSVDRPFFNPEEHISEKREWSRRYTQSQSQQPGRAGGGGATAAGDRLFEHFAVVGLPPTVNIKAVAADIKTFQRVSREAGGGGRGDTAAEGGLEITADTPREGLRRQYGLKGPAHAAEVLYSFPQPAMPSGLEQGLAAFCFPHGVRPELLERTPSMSALNEVIYSQPYQTHDDHSFVFLMKVADPGSATPRTLYGVCCYVRELVHRPPSMARQAYPGCTAPLSRYLVVAPRCYCLLTHHPFFALHFRVLQTVLGLERLERMSMFADELAQLEGGAGPMAASSLASSSAGPSSATSISQGTNGGSDGAATSAAAAAAPAGAAAEEKQQQQQQQQQQEEEGGSEASSRRWTEGSGAAEGQAQGGDLAAGMLELTLADQQQRQQARRPTRLAQVSPHCPDTLPAAAGGAEAVTPPDSSQARPASAASDASAPTPAAQVAAAAVGPTPFFTPVGPSSAVVGTQGRRSITAQWEQAEHLSAVPEESGGSGSIRRVLESSLDAADGTGGRGIGMLSPGAAAEAAIEAAEAALAASSRPGSRQRQGRVSQQEQDGDDASSDAGSYLTASSSTALLSQQASLLGGSPAPATALGARLGQHMRSASGTSLASASTAANSPAPALAAAMTAAGSEAGQQAAGQEPPPLLQLLLEQPAAEQPPSPFPDLGDVQAAEQRRRQQLALLGGETGDALDRAKLHWQPQSLPRQAEPLLHDLVETPLRTQHLGSGVAVRVVRRSYSSPATGHPPPDTLPRADLLTSSTLTRTAVRHQLQLHSQAAEVAPPQEQPEAGGGGTQQAAGGDQQPPAAQQPAQQQQVAGQPQQAASQQEGLVRREVVRVTASNLDMSRPLRSADLLAVYHASVVPRPGQAFEFQPDPGLQTITFERPDLAEAAQELGLRPDAASLPDIDAAQNLRGWAVAALCRSMSLDNLLTFLTAALLERQIVVFCPNAGVLSGIVLSLVPLLLPFHWQCLLLPVLPAGEGRLELMEAPVPFVLGVLYKTPEVRAKCASLIRVNVYKDRIKNAGGLPPLPQQAALHDALAGTYAELRKIGLTRTATTRPVHMISDAQRVLAQCFLSTLQKYLRGLMADLRAYCITDVSASMERTSVLLKDSFVDSFPPRDRPFMRGFAETQMFSVYTDSVLV